MKWLNILLIGSLAFNLAFFATLTYKVITGRFPFQSKTADHTSAIDSNGKSEQNYHKIQQILEENRMLREKTIKSRQRFAEILRAKKFDENKARQALNDFIESRQEMERSLGENLINMRKTMTPQQAREYLSRSRNLMRTDLDSLDTALPGRFQQNRIAEDDSLLQNPQNRREIIRQRLKQRAIRRRAAQGRD